MKREENWVDDIPMKQNKYDDPNFFESYNKMHRSIEGPDAAGEWPDFQSLLPDFAGKKVLDLGCGFGWHCRYARQNHARSVVGVDISEKMLERARRTTNDRLISYAQAAIEDIEFDAEQFDVVISSLALHYVQDFELVCRKVHHCLSQEGSFVFSVEHPIYTALPTQDWCIGPRSVSGRRAKKYTFYGS